VELQNSFGTTTAAEIVPTLDTTAGDTITVSASYIDLSTTRDISVTDISVESLQIEPANSAVITGETQAVSLIITLSDGTVIDNPARAITSELDDETAFTVGSINVAGQQQLVSTETTGSAEFTATFCARLDGDDASANTLRKTATMQATHYAGDDAELKILQNFNGLGAETVDENIDYRLPTDTSFGIAGQLIFPNGVTRQLSAGSVTWTASDTEGECNDDNACAATIDGLGNISNSTAGTVVIDGSFNTLDDVALSVTDKMTLNIVDINYQTPSFELRDESRATIDTSTDPAVSLTNNTVRVLRFIALLVDDKGTADTGDDETYELPVNPNFVLDDASNADLLTASGSILSASSEGSISSATINISSDLLPGSTEAGFSNNIPSFTLEVHQLEPGNIMIDADGDLNEPRETTATMTVGETLQLQSFLPFAGKDSVLQTGVTNWVVNNTDSEFVNVQNLTSDGLVTALAAGTATVTAKHQFVTANGDTHDSEAEIVITVNAAPAP
jgi:hypothetical protein